MVSAGRIFFSPFKIIEYFLYSWYSACVKESKKYDPMDNTTLKVIEKKLLEQKKTLEYELSAIGKKGVSQQETQDFDARFPNYGDKEDENAAEVATFSDRLAIERTLENDLKDVNKALKNIQDGTYGRCKYCGKPIDERRLMARPTSGSCVDCKKKLKGEN